MSCSLGKRGLGKRMVRLLQPRTQALGPRLLASKELGYEVEVIIVSAKLYILCTWTVKDISLNICSSF